MSRLSPSEKAKLPDDDFCLVQGRERLLPIVDAEDVVHALHLLGAGTTFLTSEEKDTARKRLRRICAKKGLKLPDTADYAAPGTGGPDVLTATVAFACDSCTEQAQGEWVTRHAPIIFRAGRYAFPEEEGGEFTLTPDDVRELVRTFQPVFVDDAHRPRSAPPSALDPGDLGVLEAVTPAPDFSSFGGRLRIPYWLHRKYAGKALPLSARFDRATKRLTDIGIVRQARIPDAAAFSAWPGSDAAARARAEADAALATSPVGRSILGARAAAFAAAPAPPAAEAAKARAEADAALATTPGGRWVLDSRRGA